MAIPPTQILVISILTFSTSRAAPLLQARMRPTPSAVAAVRAGRAPPCAIIVPVEDLGAVAGTR